MEPSGTLPWVVFGVVTALALIQTARLALRDLRARWTLRARMRRAAAGERAAATLLERAGYRIRGRQVGRTVRYGLDGAPCDVEVRADYLVERGGALFVAEVKTGRDAPELRHPPTRRQLLEYAHAFGTRGVLLVDPEQGRVRRVALPRSPGSSRFARDLTLLAVGAALGALALYAASRWNG